MPTLKFNIQQQEMPNWCWAAVSTSIFKFYRPQSPITQRQFASDFLGIVQCRQTLSPRCNQQASLSDALHMLKIFNGRVDNFVPVDVVENELNNKKPVGCLLSHPDFSGHFVVLSALFRDPGDPRRVTVRIEDPRDASERIVSYPEFIHGFRSSHWVKTYFTKPLPFS